MARSPEVWPLAIFALHSGELPTLFQFSQESALTFMTE